VVLNVQVQNRLLNARNTGWIMEDPKEGQKTQKAVTEVSGQ
jgi:hypothetical protein